MMARRRNYKRDRVGRFARVASSAGRKIRGRGAAKRTARYEKAAANYRSGASHRAEIRKTMITLHGSSVKDADAYMRSNYPAPRKPR